MENQLEELRKLVNTFSYNIDSYKSSRYDEENTKIDFIDKFFKILGWDVYNESGYSEDFRDVLREDKVRIEGRPKSPDYAYKQGNERLFFVEAKKPSINIKDGIEPAYQLRRYGYTAKVPLSILTDFEEFAVYDTRVKPDPKDKAGTARIFYCTYNEYEKNWEFISGTFSKQAVLKGALKKYMDDSGKKKGTQPVDKELLKQIETWRANLAETIALKNVDISVRKLNESVQKIIDRIIFLRIAEDRNTEVYGFLQKLAEEKNIYAELVKYFTISNKKYNSGLFAVVDWIDYLIIDDKTLKSIIADLYYPNPYEFSVLPIEILGQIYEQFLGKTITFTRKTKYGHAIEVEKKPEVRKAGGVYYTPQYIVDDIVQNTVGKKIEKQAPKQIEKLTILDPACGSGSFLVGAYKHLLNYHLDYYTDSKQKSKALKEGAIYQADETTYRLSIREKKKILLNNIYGVDIDPLAVEVTKLSLLLKLMEGEHVESKGELFLKSISEALLPDLSNNIKCGNSLIGTDFYKDKDLSLFDEEDMYKINCFDWEREFPQIFRGKRESFDKEYFEKNLIKGVEKAKEAIGIAQSAYEYTSNAYEYAKRFELVKEPELTYMAGGGFDVVIGNPPYLLVQEIENNKQYYDIFLKNFVSAQYKIDLFHLFIEKGIMLLKEKGYISYITPNTYLQNKFNDKLRKFILDETTICEFMINKDSVFRDASVDTSIFLFMKGNIENNIIKVINKVSNQVYTINQNKFNSNLNFEFNIVENVHQKSWMQKIENISVKFGEIGNAYFGIQTFDRKLNCPQKNGH